MAACGLNHISLQLQAHASVSPLRVKLVPNDLQLLLAVRESKDVSYMYRRSIATVCVTTLNILIMNSARWPWLGQGRSRLEGRNLSLRLL